jgi:hypothetical protein
LRESAAVERAVKGDPDPAIKFETLQPVIKFESLQIAG